MVIVRRHGLSTMRNVLRKYDWVPFVKIGTMETWVGPKGEFLPLPDAYRRVIRTLFG